MPVYLYRIKATDERFEASHRMSERPRTLGELSQAAGLDLSTLALSNPSPDLEVERLIVPVAGKVQDFNADIRGRGFAKMVKRSDGTYENVTAPKG